MNPRIYCTVPYFGFKAKQDKTAKRGSMYCTVPYFGFKAKQSNQQQTTERIVLCLILDSRQN